MVNLMQGGPTFSSLNPNTLLSCAGPKHLEKVQSVSMFDKLLCTGYKVILIVVGQKRK